MYPAATSTGCAADVTRSRLSAATGGMAAPLPSSTTRSGDSDRATATPSNTFDTATAPASPPPQRRHPMVTTPATTAVSRWSEAACRPRRRQLEQRVDGRPDAHDLRLGRPAAAHRDDDDLARPRERASDMARTAVLPTRFPVPITASVATSTGSIGGGVKRKSGPS